MSIYAQRPWQQHLPESLQHYHLDLSQLADNSADLLTQAAAHFEAKIAFSLVLPSGLSHSLSFRQIDRYANQLAAYLQHHLGLVPGDVVGLQLPNSLHYPIAVFACWKVGLIVTNINPLYTPRELEYQLLDSGAKALIVSDLFIHTFERVIQNAPAMQQLKLITASLADFFAEPYAGMIQGAMQRDALEQHRPLEPSVAFSTFADALAQAEQLKTYLPQQHSIAVYQYTGGTTGRSKGAIIQHQNLLALVRSMSDNLRAYGADHLSAQDCILTAIPLYHIFAFSVNFLMFFETGAHNVLIPSPRPISNLKPAFEQFKITWMTGVDTLYTGLLAEDWFRNNPPQLTCAISGGTALRPITAQQWRNHVGLIVEGFGMTETSCAALLHPPITPVRQGSVGFPLPGTDIKIIDPSGQELPLGEAGELCVRGPQIVCGYLNRPEESQQTFVDGWLHTGDIAKVDTEGFCYILDRKKDMVNVSGFNVYPNEVEAILTEHPEIIEAAVVSIPDAQTGEAVKAFITTHNPELALSSVIQHCKDNLTAYKVPKLIEIVPELPKSTVGKILRAELRNIRATP